MTPVSNPWFWVVAVLTVIIFVILFNWKRWLIYDDQYRPPDDRDQQ